MHGSFAAAVNVVVSRKTSSACCPSLRFGAFLIGDGFTLPGDTLTVRTAALPLCHLFYPFSISSTVWCCSVTCTCLPSVLQVFFAILLGALSIGQATPNLEELGVAAGAMEFIYETIHRVGGQAWANVR